MTTLAIGPSARRAAASLATLAVVLGALSGCGTAKDDAVGADVEERTSDYLITSEALPAGWGDSNSQGLDYRLTVCGVDVEPVEPVRAANIRFSEGPLGPFLEQHVRIYRDDEVSDVITALADALPGCDHYSAKGSAADSPEATFKVEPLTIKNAPADSVAWRQITEGDLPVTQDIVLVKRGDRTAVLLMSYAIRDTPDPAVLDGAVADLPEGA